MKKLIKRTRHLTCLLATRYCPNRGEPPEGRRERREGRINMYMFSLFREGKVHHTTTYRSSPLTERRGERGEEGEERGV